MLTNARVDSRILAKLMALMVTCDQAKPASESGDDVKARLLDLSNEWNVRAFLAQYDILQEPPTRSQLLRAGSFLDPLEDIMSKRLRQISEAVGGDFSASLTFRMNDESFASVSAVDRRAYAIDIGLRLLVQLFLGAITLSQPGSESSSCLLNPYRPQHGDAGASVYASQSPLLQALEASAFKFLLPEEAWRRLLAYELFSKAAEYALLHEFGHASRGHIEFLTNYGLSAERSEEGGLIGPIAPLTHQLLEAQADDSASWHMVAKWKHLAGTHRFQDGPLMLNRYGFCVTRPEDAHLVIAYAFALLFFILDAEDRGAPLVVGRGDARTPLYPTPAYRSWRALVWQASMGVAPAPWRTCIERVRNDLAADRFPHASSIFGGQLSRAELEAYDQLLIDHSRVHEQGRALMTHEAAYGQMAEPQRPLPEGRFWGETRPSLLWTIERLVTQILRSKQ